MENYHLEIKFDADSIVISLNLELSRKNYKILYYHSKKIKPCIMTHLLMSMSLRSAGPTGLSVISR